MATPARIFIEGSPSVFKKNDGDPGSVVPDLRAWVSADRPGDFLSWVEKRRATEHPKTFRMLIAGEIHETVHQYERVHFASDEILHNGIVVAEAGVDYEYMITSDGRIFGGMEL